MSIPTLAPDCLCPEAPAGLSRRTLLRGLAATGALGGVLTAVEGFGAHYAFAASPAAYTGDVLVVLSLRGGFDGLNAVVPIGDPGYLKARPTIGIHERSLIPAGGVFGLHPALKPLKKFWDAGTFGAVHAVGQDSPTRSHFQAMQELERAAPGSGLRTGWIDRTLGSRSRGTIFQASQVGSTQVPLALAGPNPEMALGSVDSFRIGGAWDAAERKRWTKALTAMNAGAPESISAPATATLRATATTASMAAYHPANGATYPKDSAVGDALRDVARMIKANVGLQVACVDEGDWDMHAAMGSATDGWMHDHLSDLALALAAFATDLGSRFRKVTVVTLSEFGRRVAENGSGGVDHGHGNAVLLMGGGVVGGKVHGRWPGLSDADLVDGDLAGTTDYRQILGEILQKRCGAGSLAQIFPGLSGSPLGIAIAP
ncbi:DUF1501 domain-containing protein [Kineosporia sp. NBRC 101731]|uniref:DUF1501 domain-containing protein n=1 Tax=Kineosporia sp. NBRC 101731 TaxID=3032199 RepID=UPI0024A098C1|nr:DUF1501 domain-containing protein [Kineosporia sp. NBRC 101731]GLY27160.1 hypothetical protein Kisp02_05250 [Kineosporia sp. NBRC 101731]